MARFIRRHFSDEVPDVDERDADLTWMAEREWSKGHCERCGIEGHVGSKCPVIQPYLLKRRHA